MPVLVAVASNGHARHIYIYLYTYITISCFARIKFSGPVIVLRTWTNFYTIFCKLLNVLEKYAISAIIIIFLKC